MTAIVPISELKQRTGQILQQVVTGRQDVIIERYGQEYAVILSRSRYQELLDAAHQAIRERFLAAQAEIYAATEEIPEAEIEALVEQAVTASRRARAGVNASRD
jgi:prevent-host-death family protein